MENRGLVKRFLLLLLVATFPVQVSAYAVETHGELTKAILTAYEQQHGNVFTEEQEAVIVQGSKDEDDAQRFLNHFIDGESGEGILNYEASAVWASDILEQANWGLGKLGIGRLKSTDVLFSGERDYTWERAVYEYAHGSEVRGVEALGHILHLVEDATVPAHVRDDLHPYVWGIGDRDEHEEFYKEFTAASINTSSVTALYFDSVQQALQETATFTQENFLSKDTLFRDYTLPSRDNVVLESTQENGEGQYFGVGHLGKIVRIKQWRDKTQRGAPQRENYFLTDENHEILTENWEVLSQRAIASGMGVINLFFEEVKKEKETGRLLAMNKSRLDTEHAINALADVRDMKTRITSLAAADVYELNKAELDGYFAAAEVYDIHVPTVARNSPLQEEEGSVSNESQGASALSGLTSARQSIVGEAVPEGTPPARSNQGVESAPETEGESTQQQETKVEQDKVIDTEEEKETEESDTAPENSDSFTSVFEPGGYGYGGGGGGSSASSAESSVPSMPVVTVPSDLSATLYGPSIDFAGTAETGATLFFGTPSATLSKTVNTDGTWEIDAISLDEGDVSISITASNSNGESEALEATLTVVHRPEAPTVTYPSTDTVATTTIAFAGTGDSGNLLSATIGTTTATTTIAGDGTWSLSSMTFTEGTTATTFTQTDDDGDVSEALTFSLVVDVTPPNIPSLTVLQCEHTLRTNSECLSGTTDVGLEWEAVDGAAYYGVSIEGALSATTTATSTVAVLNDQENSEVVLIAYDAAGNSASSDSVDVEVFANPVVITEIAWGGTRASSEDEWIELYNRTDYELSLEDVILKSKDDAFSIQLTGTGGTGTYWLDRTYLIERGSDSVTSKGAELVADWDLLSDDGVQLMLQVSTSTLTYTLDETPAVAECSGWCGGTNSDEHRSMERIDPATIGNDASNWQSNDGYAVRNEYKDSNGDKIYGTVKQESSEGYPEYGYFCSPYDSSFEEGGTYSPSVPSNLSTQNCTYLAQIWDDGFNFDGMGFLFEGEVGSATSTNGHSIGGIKTTQNGDITDELEDGDVLTVAMLRYDTSPTHSDEITAFVDFISGVSTSTPANDYWTLTWIYSK